MRWRRRRIGLTAAAVKEEGERSIIQCCERLTFSAAEVKHKEEEEERRKRDEEEVEERRKRDEEEVEKPSARMRRRKARRKRRNDKMVLLKRRHEGESVDCRCDHERKGTPSDVLSTMLPVSTYVMPDILCSFAIRDARRRRRIIGENLDSANAEHRMSGMT